MLYRRIVTNLFTTIQRGNGAFYNVKTMISRQPMEFVNRYNYCQYKRNLSVKTLFDFKMGTFKKYQTDYVQNLKIKFKIYKLKSTYDPEFNVESFKKGANQVRYKF